MKATLAQNNTVSLLWLPLLVWVAFAIRFKGVWFGYPLPVHPDEPLLVESALRIIATGNLNPHFFSYPTLNIYIQALIYQVIQFLGFIFLDRSPSEIPTIWYYLAGRTFNVLLSILTIIVTYTIGKRLFSPLAGLVAGVFLTFSYLHIVNSYLLTVDTTVAFWTSLATLMAVLIYSEGKNTKYYLLGGIFVGLAISSKYTAFVSVAPLLIAHYTKSHARKDWIDKNVIMYLIAIPVVFLITSPYVLLDFDSFMAEIESLAATYRSGHPGAQSDTVTSYYLYGEYLFAQGYGIVPMVFAGFGLIWLLRNAPWKAAIIAATPIFLYIFIGRYKVFFPRNIVATVPFLSLLSGAFVVLGYRALMERLLILSKRWRAIVINLALVLILLACVWQQAVLAVNHIEKITLPDTRWVSLIWIEKNLPPSSRIGREHYTPPVEMYTEKFNAVYLGFFGAIKQPNVARNLDFIIVSSGDYLRFLWQRDIYPEESKAYLEFFESHELVKEFIPDNEKLGGPRISIYRGRY
jgi:4-amino-4-deoxy-L-arabinose transferase-like glycosyltransferase